jgi:hypothetical protein
MPTSSAPPKRKARPSIDPTPSKLLRSSPP